MLDMHNCIVDDTLWYVQNSRVHLSACFCRLSLLVHKMSKGMYDSRLEQLADWLRQEKDEARRCRIDRSILCLAVACVGSPFVCDRSFLPVLPVKSCLFCVPMIR